MNKCQCDCWSYHIQSHFWLSSHITIRNHVCFSLELSKTSSREYALNLRKRKKMYHLMRETLNTTKVTKTNLWWKDTWQSIFNWWFILTTFSCCIRGHTRKSHKPWKRPFKVINKINDVLYRIQAVHLHIVASSYTLTNIIPAEKNNSQNVNNTDKPE